MRPEFSRFVAAERVGPEGRDEHLVATPDECAALAARFGIPEVASLAADLHLMPEPGGTVRVTGRLRATVVQSCVVSFEPVPQTVAEAVDLRLVPDDAAPSDDPEAPDEITGVNGRYDLGEAVAEGVALALDPYPRCAGAELPELDPPGAAVAPFASLTALRRDH